MLSRCKKENFAYLLYRFGDSAAPHHTAGPTFGSLFMRSTIRARNAALQHQRNPDSVHDDYRRLNMRRLYRFVAVGCLLALPACEGSQPAVESESPFPAAESSSGAGHLELMAALRAVLAGCKVDGYGLATLCAARESEKLRELERRLAARDTMHTLCMALGEKNTKMRVLAAAELNDFTYPKGDEFPSVDEEALRCLIHALESRPHPNIARPVIRAATFVATAIGKEDDVLALVPKFADLRVRAAVYQTLWANGRLRVLPTLQNLLSEERDAATRRRILEGFHIRPPLSAEEQEQVCTLVRSQLDDSEIEVAETAAILLIQTCPALKDAVLDVAAAWLRREVFSKNFVLALRELAIHHKDAVTPEQNTRILEILAAAVRNGGVHTSTRAMAFHALSVVDEPAAIELAKDYGTKADDPTLRDLANTILDGSTNND
jgi:hypothetical protein